MVDQLSVAVAPPPHVPAHLIRDVDFFDLARSGIDAQEGWFRVQQANPDIFWTPRNGGHWMVTRADLMDRILNDPKNFSSRELMIPRGQGAPSIITLDPPEHTPLRRVLQPAFTKTVVDHLENEARVAAVATIEKLLPRGECEFTNEFAQVLPIVVFLDMMGLPQEDRDILLPPAHVIVLDNDPQRRIEASTFLSGYIKTWIDRRYDAPEDDVVSRLCRGMIDARRITPDEVLMICSLLLLGGLDTVASMLSFMAIDLAQQPALRRRMVEQPEVIPTAVEEFIRRHGLANPAREVNFNMTFEGVELEAGELIQVPNCLYGLDDRRHADPLKIDFDRKTPIRHATFGAGPHMCPGAMIARREIKVFLEEWLKRIPEFSIKPGTVPVTASGMVNGVKELHLVWQPPK